jgi:hypothetical protein
MGIENNTHIDAVLLGFSNALDKVLHQRLLTKRHHYCVRANLLDWLRNLYLDAHKIGWLID